MQVKRYRASSMQEAMETVKQDLGEDAVILKTTALPRSGLFDMMKKETVEVIAATDVSMTDWIEFSRKEGGQDTGPSSPSVSRGGRRGAEDTCPSVVRWTPKERIVSGRAEPAPVQEVRPGKSDEAAPRPESEICLTGQTVGPPVAFSDELPVEDVADLPDLFARMLKDLVACGVNRALATALIRDAAASIPKEKHRDETTVRGGVQRAMTRMINVSGPLRCNQGKSKVVALVGQTGVGKTTTLAKLATKGKFVFDKNVSLISADTYRMSAIEHLNTFAGIAHLPISAVYSPHELRSVLDAQANKDLVFIDTAGRSPKDSEHIAELKRFMETARPDEIHLVLPANNKQEDLLEAARRFSVLPINSLVLTKVDETSSLGSILNVASQIAYPISYVTNGQTIPDDIELANSQKLARLIMRAA